MKKEYKSSLIFNIKGLYFIGIFLVLNLFFFRSFAQQTNWVVPNYAINVKNPLAGNNSVLADARTLYIANCGPCHGTNGKGDGPAAPGLNPKPADHTSAAVQSETDGSLFWRLSEGHKPMPAYKNIFSEHQRWELIDYIRTLAKGYKKK